MKALFYFSFCLLSHCLPMSKDQDSRADAKTTLDIVTYGGAIPNDLSDDRVAIQKTIDAVHAAGGGTVTIPTGTFFIGYGSRRQSYSSNCIKHLFQYHFKGSRTRKHSQIKR